MKSCIDLRGFSNDFKQSILYRIILTLLDIAGKKVFLFSRSRQEIEEATLGTGSSKRKRTANEPPGASSNSPKFPLNGYQSSPFDSLTAKAEKSVLFNKANLTTDLRGSEVAGTDSYDFVLPSRKRFNKAEVC